MCAFSDPIFTAFDGRVFEFLGDPEKVYSVLSSPSMHLNMLLVEAGERHIRAQPGVGTFVQTFAVQVDTVRVAVSVTEAGNMSGWYPLPGTLHTSSLV